MNEKDKKETVIDASAFDFTLQENDKKEDSKITEPTKFASISEKLA